MYFGQLYHWKLPQVCNKHKTCNLQQLIQHKKKEFVVGCSFFYWMSNLSLFCWHWARKGRFIVSFSLLILKPHVFTLALVNKISRQEICHKSRGTTRNFAVRNFVNHPLADQARHVVCCLLLLCTGCQTGGFFGGFEQEGEANRIFFKMSFKPRLVLMEVGKKEKLKDYIKTYCLL
jgi:hypothetical protein